MTKQRAGYLALPRKSCRRPTPVGQILVAQGVGQAEEAGGAKSLARNHGDLDLVQDQCGQLGGRRRTDGPSAVGNSLPSSPRTSA